MNRIGVDIGGTFTDVVLEKSGQIFSKKYLTTPNNPEQAALNGINDLLVNYNTRLEDIKTIVHGTTIAANALIERKGAKTVLVTTEGFKDVLEMRYEKRFDQYDLDIELPEPLVTRNLRICVKERCLISGEIVKTPTESQLKKVVKTLLSSNVESVPPFVFKSEK
jgi:N-methylhydantoinase A/oxoprolinase/acetone carboxylase beta subunit